MGLQIQVLKASIRSEIEAAFATLVRDRAEALYVAGDVFFTSRRVQLATLAATHRIPASYPSREAVEAGGLMGYDADRAGMYRQVGAYTGQIPQRRQARRPPGTAINEIRVRHKPASDQGAPDRGAQRDPIARRRAH